jgi:FeoC like transcriptional regulator
VSTPLRDVLSAVEAGSGTLHDVSRRTGLADDVVRAAVDHLVRMGRLGADRLTVGCGDGGCGACPSGVDGAPGCGLPGPSPSGPVLVALTVQQRPTG